MSHAAIKQAGFLLFSWLHPFKTRCSRISFDLDNNDLVSDNQKHIGPDARLFALCLLPINSDYHCLLSEPILSVLSLSRLFSPLSMYMS